MKVAVKASMAAIGMMSAIGLSGAQAAVIDFNALVGSGLVDRGSTYTEDGFVLDHLSNNQFFSIHSGDVRFTRSVSFFNGVANGITRLTKSGGGAFDLDSIDLDSLNGAAAVTVIFIGIRLNLSPVIQEFTLDASFPVLETFVFRAGFDSVTEVSWAQVLPGHSFDNIVIAEAVVVDPPVTGVPEPVALSLLGAGLAGLGAMRRRVAK